MGSSILKSILIVSGSSILKSIVQLYIEETETIRIDFRIEEPKTIRNGTYHLRESYCFAQTFFELFMLFTIVDANNFIAASFGNFSWRRRLWRHVSHGGMHLVATVPPRGIWPANIKYYRPKCRQWTSTKKDIKCRLEQKGIELNNYSCFYYIANFSLPISIIYHPKTAHLSKLIFDS